MERTIHVELSDRSYQVRVGPGMLRELGPTASALGKVTSAVVICDSNVAPLYGAPAVQSLREANLPVSLLEFPAGEASKTLATCSQLYDRIFALRPAIDRNSLLIAVGGGVTGDLSGFVAATILRGVRWLQCPTTLLADVDASVGGKTAVDHPAGKNLIGAFHQPCGVLIDVQTLGTLPRQEVLSGLAECVKHAVIRDASLLAYIEDNAETILAGEPDVMTDFIARNVAIKAAVVSADEKETGQRAHLNFGHTVGHAIETVVGYNRMPHGHAVALGMVAACRLATRRGMLASQDAARVERILARLGLPTAWQHLDAGRILGIMQHDKKSRGGAIQMVLPSAIGKVAVFGDVPPELIRESIESLGHGSGDCSA